MTLHSHALDELSTDALAHYVSERRWFGARESTIADLDVVDVVALPGTAEPQWVVLVNVRHDTGTHDTYQLVLGVSPTGEPREPIAEVDGRSLFDASGSAALARLLVDATTSGTRVDGREGTLECFGLGERPADLADAPVRLLGADQSNTSLVVGDTLLLKLYRRVEPGLNPELEMLLFLTEREFPHVPYAAGWYGYLGAQLRATLGIGQQYLPDARDGWTLGLDEVDRDADGFLERLGALGAVVGALHAVLASDSTDPAFAPEPPTPETAGLITSTIEDEIDRTFAAIPDSDALAPVAARAEELRAVARALVPGNVGARLVRTHGDLHLGQVLWSGGEWFVTDFEGEPDRPIADRRLKTFVLRDVAGMTRSFAYLVGALERAGNPAPPGFEDDARMRFLDGYRGAVEGVNLLPPGDDAQHRLLELFELEKVLYELRYEAAHRPDWLDLPLAGLTRFLDGTAP